ncbi:MAG TPA: tyrosine-type recombinase/integrase [Candidatus Nitrosocosmicus sp.]|nr:tyrosine-type recombinase/integrase [Candidatus Nitrosocosmicus sp.]
MDTDLRGLVSRFIENLKQLGKSQFTVIAYKKDLEQFIGYISSKDVSSIRDVKKDHIDGFIGKLLQEGYTKKSASRKLNSIRTFFRYLKQEEVITVNPSLEVSHPKYNQAPPRILTKLEYRALRDFSKDDLRTYAMIELLLQTGLRIGELADIRLDQVKEDELVFGSRSIPLNKAVKKAIDDYLKVRYETADNHLFVTKTGKPLLIRNIRTIISRCFREVDIPDAKVQDLRNTFIAYQLMNGASISYISKIVGHKRLSSTEKYLQLIKQEAEKKDRLGEL